MAYIPDQAIELSHTLTATAFRLYCLMCRRRDHRDQVSRITQKRAEDLLNQKRSTIYKAFAELRASGWISEKNSNEFELRCGDFLPVDKKFLSRQSAKIEFESTAGNKFSKNPNDNSTNRNRNSGKIESSAYKEYPASSSRFSNQPTHHSRTRESVNFVNFSEQNKTGSRFSLEECMKYVEICVSKGEDIRNPKGLATNLYSTGTADAFILATIYPAEQKQIEEKTYGAPIKFSELPCKICYGGRMTDCDGKGYAPCPHCKNEKGRSTGKEPFAE